MVKIKFKVAIEQVQVHFVNLKYWATILT
jgi:hypothetical protein